MGRYCLKIQEAHSLQAIRMNSVYIFGTAFELCAVVAVLTQNQCYNQSAVEMKKGSRGLEDRLRPLRYCSSGLPVASSTFFIHSTYYNARASEKISMISIPT